MKKIKLLPESLNEWRGDFEGDTPADQGMRAARSDDFKRDYNQWLLDVAAEVTYIIETDEELSKLILASDIKGDPFEEYDEEIESMYREGTDVEEAAYFIINIMGKEIDNSIDESDESVKNPHAGSYYKIVGDKIIEMVGANKVMVSDESILIDYIGEALRNLYPDQRNLVRYLMNIDEDFISDTLQYLYDTANSIESSDDKSFKQRWGGSGNNLPF